MAVIDDGFIDHTTEEIAEFNKRSPRSGFFDLIRQHARDQGGLVLEIWETTFGPYFGKSTLRTPASTAEHLKIPLSTVEEVLNSTVEAIRPQWEASPQFAQLRDQAKQGLDGRP
jgi:hypothetical protein